MKTLDKRHAAAHALGQRALSVFQAVAADLRRSADEHLAVHRAANAQIVQLEELRNAQIVQLEELRNAQIVQLEELRDAQIVQLEELRDSAGDAAADAIRQADAIEALTR